MQSVVGIALLVVGVVLLIFGMQASASVGSRLSALFTGAPSDRTIWLVVAGVAAAIVGLGLLLAGRRRTLGSVSKVEMAMFTLPVQRHSGSQTSQ